MVRRELSLEPGSAGLALLALVLAAGCGDDDGAPTVTAFTKSDSAGIEVATTVYSEELRRAPFVVDTSPRLNVGARATDDEGVQLYEVADARWLSDGRIVVLNGGSGEILIFAGDGQLLSRAGGEGEGPGEFRRFAGFVELGPDSLLVYDVGNRRLAWLDGSGQTQGTVQLAGVEGMEPRLCRVAGTTADSALIMVANAVAPRLRDPPATYEYTAPHLVVSPDGEVLDSIGEGLRAELFGRPTSAGLIAYGSFSSADAAAGLLYEADGRPYEVRVHDTAGLRRILRLERPARVPTEADEEAHLEYLLDYSDDPARDEQARERFEQTPRAETMPWIEMVRIDRGGRVWVGEWEPFWSRSEARSWGVFGTDGRWLGSLSLPEGLRLTDVREDRIIGVWRDELDVEHVRVYDLVEVTGE